MKLKSIILKKVSILLAVFLVILIFPLSALAEGNTVGFGVKADIPENQRDNGKGYFDVIIPPGESQILEVYVVNSGDKVIDLTVTVQNAYTTYIGSIDYEIPSVQDESMPLSIEDVAVVIEPKFQLQPGESKSINISVTMPDEEFDGVILGGVIISKDLTEEEKSEDAGIINRYKYLFGLMIAQNENEVTPLVESDGAYVDNQYAQTAVIHRLRNPKAVLMEDANITLEIYRDDEETPLWVVPTTSIKLAPQSLMEYSYFIGEGDITPGNYTSVISVAWQGEEWHFKDEFVVDNNEAVSLNERNVSFAVKEETMPRWFGFAVIGVLIVILAALLYIAFSILRERKNDTGIKTSDQDKPVKSHDNKKSEEGNNE